MKKVVLLLGAVMVLAGCHTDMWVQPKTTGYKESELFEDGKSARPLEEGVVARGLLKTDSTRFKGREKDGALVSEIPASLTIWGEKVNTKTELKKVLQHGQERFDIFCSHCHGKVGAGDGMINQRGLILRRPVATYHTDRLRKMPVGHFFDVITNGYGAMFAQAPRVPVDDRWAIVAYIRALQFSQVQPKSSLSAAELQELDKKKLDPAEQAQKDGEAEHEKENAKGGH